MGLRDYKTYRINTNLQSPIMLKGLPLKLAIWFFVSFITGVISSLFLGNWGVPIVFVVIIAAIFMALIPYLLYRFYKRYGLYGFALEKRNKSLPETISADKSIKDILNGKS